MTGSRNSKANAKPPEGVLSGDTIPRENELSDSEEKAIQEVIGNLKAQGEPWIQMSDTEIRKRVKDHLVDNEVIR